MDTVIAFTPGMLLAGILALCGGIITVSGAVTVICKAFRAARKPETDQNQRITDLEKRVARHDELFRKDKLRLDAIEEGNRVTQQALLALLSHGIDGNEVAGMKAAKEKLEQFLINR